MDFNNADISPVDIAEIYSHYYGYGWLSRALQLTVEKLSSIRVTSTTRHLHKSIKSGMKKKVKDESDAVIRLQQMLDAYPDLMLMEQNQGQSKAWSKLAENNFPAFTILLAAQKNTEISDLHNIILNPMLFSDGASREKKKCDSCKNRDIGKCLSPTCMIIKNMLSAKENLDALENLLINDQGQPRSSFSSKKRGLFRFVNDADISDVTIEGFSKLHEINVKFKIKLIDGLDNLNLNEKLKTKSFKALSSHNIGEEIEHIEPTELLGDLVTTIKYMLKNTVLESLVFESSKENPVVLLQTDNGDKDIEIWKDEEQCLYVNEICELLLIENDLLKNIKSFYLYLEKLDMPMLKKAEVNAVKELLRKKETVVTFDPKQLQPLSGKNFFKAEYIYDLYTTKHKLLPDVIYMTSEYIEQNAFWVGKLIADCDNLALIREPTNIVPKHSYSVVLDSSVPVTFRVLNDICF